MSTSLLKRRHHETIVVADDAEQQQPMFKHAKLAVHGTCHKLYSLSAVRETELRAVATYQFMSIIQARSAQPAPFVRTNYAPCGYGWCPQAFGRECERIMPLVNFGSVLPSGKTVLQTAVDASATDHKGLQMVRVGERNFLAACFKYTLEQLPQRTYGGSWQALFLSYTMHFCPASKSEFQMLQQCLDKGVHINAQSAEKEESTLPHQWAPLPLPHRWVGLQPGCSAAVMWALRQGADINGAPNNSFIKLCVDMNQSHILSEALAQGFLRNVDFVTPVDDCGTLVTPIEYVRQLASVTPAHTPLLHMLLETRDMQAAYVREALVESDKDALTADIANIVAQYACF